MEFGICNLSIVPVRSEPTDKSEMLTQILFGELVVLSEKIKNWIKIRLVYDNYEGWIDEKQFLPISEDTFSSINNINPNITLDLVQILTNTSLNKMIPVVLGSSLPGLENQSFLIENYKYTYEGQVTTDELKTISIELVENALMYLNAPYLWGGRSPFGIDCSGFTQMSFKICGIKLLRNASQQAEQGEDVSFIDEAEQGDLVFFDDEEGNIIHVGILLSEKKIIHSSGRVRIDSIDHQGIYNNELKKYTHKLRLIKKII
ncbi:MAG: C40 family peptidase [Bacteroidales bacterium]|nr:C40 family peptidase [Bacteroidales bacterium]